MWKFNTHFFPSIRPFPVPLEEGFHSLGQPTISKITLHFYHCIYDSTSPLCFPSAAVKQRSSETDEATALSIPEPWPRALGRGLCHPGLGCVLGSSLCCWRDGGGLNHGRNALPECCFLSGSSYGAKWARTNSRWMHLHWDLEVPPVWAPWCKNRRHS